MISALLPPASRKWLHVETCNRKGVRPIDQTRYRFDSNDPAAVLADCRRAKANGFDALMYNSYAHGSFEDKARDVYIAATQQAGLNQFPNIDGANITSGPAYLGYLDYTVRRFEALPNAERYNGKLIVTLFGKSGEQAAWLQAGEAKYPNVCFIYYDTPYGKNRMDWIKILPDPVVAQQAFCQKYGNLNDGGLYIPCVFAGFDDTVMRKVNDKWQGDPNGTLKATSVWPSGNNQYIPARVAPPEGPNVATLARTCDNVMTWFPKAFAVQYITGTDFDEGTACSFGIPKL